MVTSNLLMDALRRWSAALQAAAPELNAADATLGDGDLGATLDKCARNVLEGLDGLPPDLAGIFSSCAQACAKASGSSFGTLLAVAFLTASKAAGPAERLGRAQIVGLLDQVVAALAARGGAVLGDKTMLDSLDAIARALEAAPATADERGVTVQAAQSALDSFRLMPNRIGRARMFADRSVGIDDPGMVAILKMAESL